ncbi:hypothetical protein NECID01_1339 [Nematocida sp. AWRm77]|nr:hypothetical protein NECID01_1339 [Nematocida sp. AWRm77]
MDGIKFQKVEAVLRVPLLPAQLSKVSEGVYGYLNKLVGEYVKVFKGVVVCYSENIGMTEEMGTVLDTEPSVYFKVHVEFLVLRIIVGETATGVLESNRKGFAELSTYGVLPVKIRTEDNLSPGVHAYRISSVSINKLCLTGAFI